MCLIISDAQHLTPEGILKMRLTYVIFGRRLVRLMALIVNQLTIGGTHDTCCQNANHTIHMPFNIRNYVLWKTYTFNHSRPIQLNE
jgi:hypothetical protein